MVAYHHMLVHFPLALWTTAALIVLIRAFSSGPLPMAADRLLVPLLWLGNLTGLVAYGSGLMTWHIDALTYTPMGRNHILAATWTLAYWVLVAALRQWGGVGVWEGGRRWLMLLLAALGAGLLAVTGTLGGHLTGSATALSALLRELGWEVYTTFYLPTWMLVTTALVGLLLLALGVRARRQKRRPEP